MAGFQVTLPLQMACRLMIATQVGQNLTLPLNWNGTLVEPETLQVVLEQAEVGVTSSPRLPSGYVTFPEFGFAYKLTETQLTRDDARKMCLKDNGQLAVTDSREKVDKILNHFHYDERFWVGLQQMYGLQRWTTIDGKSTDNFPWASGYPIGDERCGSLRTSDNGLTNYNCTATAPYLCETALS